MAEYLRSEYIGLDSLSAEGPERLKNLLEYSMGNITIIINEEEAIESTMRFQDVLCTACTIKVEDWRSEKNILKVSGIF